tara:strand:+ start:1263 stop:1436 length:174 start_codon:yes stop_codon:yes gene_type:complete
MDEAIKQKILELIPHLDGETLSDILSSPSYHAKFGNRDEDNLITEEELEFLNAVADA